MHSGCSWVYSCVTHSSPDPHVVVAVAILEENEVVYEEDDIDQYVGPLGKHTSVSLHT